MVPPSLLSEEGLLLAGKPTRFFLSFFFLKYCFDVDHFLKVFIEFVIILLLFYVVF